MTKSICRPLAGRQWREAANKKPLLRLPEAKPSATPPKRPAAAPATQTQPSPIDGAAREMARRIADNYCTRDGQRLPPNRPR
jgi:hypothetical protein